MASRNRNSGVHTAWNGKAVTPIKAPGGMQVGVPSGLAFGVLACLEKMGGKVEELPAETRPKQLEDSPKPRTLRSFLAGRVGRNYRTHPNGAMKSS